MFSLFRSRQAPKRPPAPTAVVPTYPAPADRLPVAAPDVLLESHADVVASIRQSLGWPRERFDALPLGMLERFAAYANLLPADESHHNAAGGLMAHALTSGFFSLRASEGAVFAMDVEPKIRRELEPRYRLAALLAGVLADVGKPLSAVEVTAVASTSHARWNPYVENLIAWAQPRAIVEYRVRWTPIAHARRSEAIAILLMREILGVDGLAFITEHGSGPLDALLGAILGQSSTINPLADLVTRGRNASVEEDLARASRSVGAHRAVDGSQAMVTRVTRAARALVRSGVWTANQKGQPLLITTMGLHLQWPEAGRDLVGHLRSEGDRAFPEDPTVLLRILDENRLLARFDQGDQSSPTWTLYMPVTAAGGPVIALQTVRLARGDALFEAGVPAVEPLNVSTTPPPPPAEQASEAAPASKESAAAPNAPKAAKRKKAGAEAVDPQLSLGVGEPSADRPAPTPAPVAAAGAYSSGSVGTPDVVNPSPTPTVAATDRNPSVSEIESELAEKGRAGATMRAILQDIERGLRAVAFEPDGTAVLVYPKAFAALGTDPESVLRLVAEAGWLLESEAATSTGEVRLTPAVSGWCEAYVAVGVAAAGVLASEFVAHVLDGNRGIAVASLRDKALHALVNQFAKAQDIDVVLVAKRLLQAGLVVRSTSADGEPRNAIDPAAWDRIRGA